MQSIAAEAASYEGRLGWLLVGLLFVGLTGIQTLARAFSIESLDDFSNPSAWKPLASDQVSSSLRPTTGIHGKALCLAYDFNGVSGYAAMRRELPITFPPDYEFDFNVRGNGPANAFEFKLIDASGDNVWWVSKPNTIFSSDWMPVRYKKRHVSPAWGPLKDKTLRKSQFVEFTVSANSGGKGEVCIEDLRLREREASPPILPAPRVTATSGHIPATVLSFREHIPPPNSFADPPLREEWHGIPWAYADQRLWSPSEHLPSEVFWRSEGDAEQTITIDFGFEREFGGLSLLWLPNEQASDYRVEFSDDGAHWREARHVIDGNGAIDHLHLAESETRFLRLHMSRGPAAHYGLVSIDVEPLEFGATANAFVESLARELPRGFFPRGFSSQQTYWTLVGVDGGHESGLLSEDGALEVARGGFSITPFVSGGSAINPSQSLASGWCSPESAMYAAQRGRAIPTNGLYDWAKVRIAQALADGYLPMPRVDWSYQQPLDANERCPISVDTELRRIKLGLFDEPARTVHVRQWHLAIDTFAKSDMDSSRLFATYTLTNVSDSEAEYRLLLAIQPFQVNPPVQFLTTPGGVSPIHELGFDGKAVSVNGKQRVWPLQAPTAFFATPFDNDMVAQHLTYNEWPTAQHVIDETGLGFRCS